MSESLLKSSTGRKRYSWAANIVVVGWVLVAIALLSEPAARQAHSITPSGGEIHAAYVLLGPSVHGDSPAAFARVIVGADQNTCPQLLGGPAPISMTFRPNPHGFEVKVCEAAVPFGQRLRVSWSGTRLPPAPRKPTHVVVMADTGCEASDCPGNVPATPFDRLAAAAAKLEPRPDVILHAGDYNYRGTPSTVTDKNTGDSLSVYSAGDHTPDDPECELDVPYVSRNASYSESPDTWNHWRNEFFGPARRLMSRAPWIFTRGNHELCSQAGPGWFYFLDASSEPSVGGTGQLQCPPQGGTAPPDDDVFQYLQFTEPRVLSFENLRIVVIDSANACDDFTPARTTSRYRDQLEQVFNDVPQKQTTWLATHRAVWAAVQEKTPGPGESAAAFPPYETINRTLQRATMAALTASGKTALPKKLELGLSGHIHTFESLNFLGGNRERRPPQLLVGNSGVALEGSATDGTFNARVDGAPARLVGVNEHGILDIRRLDANGSWSGALVNSKAEVLAQCSTRKLPEFICTRCDTSREIQALFDDPATPGRARKLLDQALGNADQACAAANFRARRRWRKRTVSLLLKAARKGADAGPVIDHIVSRVASTASAQIRKAVEKVGSNDRNVEKAQLNFARGSTKRNPNRAILLFRRAYNQAARALSGR